MNEPNHNAVLYVIATPIGNLEDISQRALRILGECDVIASEDTRHTRKIFSRFELRTPPVFFCYHEHNEHSAGQKIIKLLREGKKVALCSDAGTPGVSDPGYRIISDTLDKGFTVDIIPGASACITALLASGLPSSSFTFKGFPPRKQGQRKHFLEAEKEQPHTLIFYESPQRTADLLTDALATLGNRKAAVCIDLTKLFQEIRRGSLFELYAYFRDKTIKGEVSVVIAGNNRKFMAPLPELPASGDDFSPDDAENGADE